MDYLKPIILDLIQFDFRKEAWNLIDIYFNKAQTINDYDVLGYVSLKADKRETYLACAEACYAMSIDLEHQYKSKINLYKAYNVMNYPEKALFYIEQILQINPNDFDALCSKAANVSLLGYKKEAEEILEKLTILYPEKRKSLKPGFSGKLLREGKLSEGIQSFLQTSEPKSTLFIDQLKMHHWDGTIEPNTVLYVEGMGGIGDEIINIRFLDTLKKLGMCPILYSNHHDHKKSLDEIFIRHGYNVLKDPYSINTKCKWIPLMSLPVYLNLEEKDLWSGTYLKPLRKEKNIIKSNKFKIGIKCSGNPYFAQDEYRKIPIEKMLEYLPKNAEIYYIDKDKINKEGLIDLSDKIETWEDTLDFIDQMDCIVSSCTSLVHAAGAMGKTTFVAVPIAEYYIWTTSRTDNSSPWYGDNFYVMRQTKVRDWNDPLSQINEHIKKIFKVE